MKSQTPLTCFLVLNICAPSRVQSKKLWYVSCISCAYYLTELCGSCPFFFFLLWILTSKGDLDTDYLQSRYRLSNLAGLIFHPSNLQGCVTIAFYKEQYNIFSGAVNPSVPLLNIVRWEMMRCATGNYPFPLKSSENYWLTTNNVPLFNHRLHCCPMSIVIDRELANWSIARGVEGKKNNQKKCVYVCVLMSYIFVIVHIEPSTFYQSHLHKMYL